MKSMKMLAKFIFPYSTYEMKRRVIFLFLLLVGCLFLLSHSSLPFSSVVEVKDESHDLRRQLSTIVYDNLNDTYSPSAFVKYGHKISGQDFDANKKYVKRVLYVPFAILCLGVLAFLGLLLGLMSRLCCECGKCLPDVKNANYEQYRFYHSIVFYVLAFLVVAFDQLIFMGMTSLDKGLNTINDALQSVKDLFDDMNSEGDGLTVLGDDLATEYAAAKQSCPAANYGDISSYLESYDNAVSEFQDSIDKVLDSLNKVLDHSENEGTLYRTICLYVMWGIAVISVFLFLGGHVLQKLCLSQFAVTWGMIVYLIFLILGALWLLTTSVLADFCMDPSYNAVKSLPTKNDLRSLGVYYTTCNGTNPLQNDINEGWEDIHKLNNSVNALLNSTCYNNNDLLQMRTTINSIADSFTTVEQDLSCPPLQTLWFSFVNDGLCDDTYTGIFYVWGSQIFTSFFLFFLCLTAVVVYQYYGGVRVVPGEDLDDFEDRRLQNAAPKVAPGADTVAVLA